MINIKKCKFKDCNKSSYYKNEGRRGWCSIHYRRWQRYKDPSICKYAPDGNGCIFNGYKIITINNKQIYEHRYIMEQHLNRKLNSREIIHHINGDTLDNRIKNLMINNQSNHAKYHGKIRYKHLRIPCDSCDKIFKCSSWQRKSKHVYCSNKCAHFEKKIDGKSYVSHYN